MCGGGGFSIPLWAIPILFAAEGVKMVNSSVSAMPALVQKTSQGLRQRAETQVKAWTTPHIVTLNALNTTLKEDPSNGPLYLQRALLLLVLANDENSSGPVPNSALPPPILAVVSSISNSTTIPLPLATKLLQASENDISTYRSLGGAVTSHTLNLYGLLEDRRCHFVEAIESFTKAIQLVEQEDPSSSSSSSTSSSSSDSSVPSTSGSSSTAEHQFMMNSFKVPTFCVQCKNLLLGFTNQGYKCGECGIAIHPNCRSKYSTPCKPHPKVSSSSSSGSAGGISERHHFEVKNFYTPTWCGHCKGFLTGLTRQGMGCTHCQMPIHEKCLAGVAEQVCSPELYAAATTSSRSPTSLPDLYNNRGLAYYHNSQYAEALVDFAKALSLCSEGTEQRYLYLSNRGLCHFYLEDYDSSIADLSEAIAHGCENEQIYSTRASAFQLLNRNVEAESDRRRAQLFNPKAELKVFPYPLPLEVVASVFDFLDCKDLYTCALTCRLWHDLVWRIPKMKTKKVQLEYKQQGLTPPTGSENSYWQ
jgi:hypothetical protein